MDIQKRLLPQIRIAPALLIGIGACGLILAGAMTASGQRSGRGDSGRGTAVGQAASRGSGGNSSGSYQGRSSGLAAPPATARSFQRSDASSARSAGSSGSVFRGIASDGRGGQTARSGLVAQTDRADKHVVSDTARTGGGSGAATTKRAADSPTFSDLRKRIPDAAGSKSGGANSMRKSGSGDAAARDFGNKSDTMRKSDAVKLPTDRPKISDLRKRIPDVSDGKLKPADGLQKKSGADISKLPGKGHLDAGKLPDLGGKPGGLKMPGDIKSGMKIVAPGVAGAGRGKLGNEGLGNARFPDRVKKGDFDALAKSQIGQKIKLADQYRMAQQGDVARRLALHQHGNVGFHGANVAGVQGFHHHPDFHYRGWISPIYRRHCFEYRCHFGPAWYPGIWWYPRWAPWVHWSWHHPCHPFWDPRPIWCRPVTYVVVAQPWVWWEYPVWTPLYAVPAGTWVEVQKPVIEEAQYDLQLLAVRFVDPGHPDEKLGPRYRVWFRNNSSKPITQAFDVRLFATPGEQLSRDAPQAGVRVTAVEAGDSQSVDVRLPFDAAQAGGDAQGKPVSFKYLQVLVDANREVHDVNQANNGTRLTTGEVLPVDPAAFETDPKSVAAGGELIVAGEGLGPEPGKVIVHLGNIELEAELLGWYDLGVRLKMPDLPLAETTQADLIVIRGDGAAANPVTITVSPPQRNAPEANAPAPPLPAPQINPPAPPVPQPK
jgi:hypothetical protein